MEGGISFNDLQPYEFNGKLESEEKVQKKAVKESVQGDEALLSADGKKTWRVKVGDIKVAGYVHKPNAWLPIDCIKKKLGYKFEVKGSNNERIIIKTKSFANRTLQTPQEVLDAKYEKIDQLEDPARSVKKTGKVSEKILEQMRKGRDDDLLKNKEENHKFTTAIRNINKNIDNIGCDSIKLCGKEFYIHKSEEVAVQEVKVHMKGPKIAEGGYGEVSHSPMLSKTADADEYVVKLFKDEKIADNREAMIKALLAEKEYLDYLHDGSGVVEGIMDKVITLIYAMSDDGTIDKTQPIGYLVKKYNGDLYNIIKKDKCKVEDLKDPKVLKERLILMSNVLKGLVHVHEKGILHSDIKPENILKDKDGKFVLADFGIALKKSEINDVETLRSRACTHPFTPYDDMIKIQIIKERTNETSDIKIEDAFQVAMKSDVFAMGSSIYNFLTGNFAYKIGEAKASPPKDYAPNFDFKDIKGIPPKLNEWLKNTMNNDCDFRPSAQKALESLEAIITEDIPKWQSETNSLAKVPWESPETPPTDEKSATYTTTPIMRPQHFDFI